MERICKSDFLKEIENFKGKKQYFYSTFKMDINEVLKTLEDNFDSMKHISTVNYRTVYNIKKHGDGFQTNGSNYYFKPFTNIYKIIKGWCTYYILHDTKNNGIVIYENLI